MSHKLQAVSLILAALLVLTGCKVKEGAQEPTFTVAIPTNTLAPIVSFTPRFTATLIPSETLTPTITPTPTNTQPTATPTATPTITPTAMVLGSINFTSPSANLRAGPGQKYALVQPVKAGTAVLVLGMTTEKDWLLVRLTEEGIEGWVLADLVTVSAIEAVSVLATEDLARLTQTAPAPSAGPTSAVGAVHAAGVEYKNDVLAYCDNKTNGEPRKSIPSGTPVTIFWSWFAKTPDLLKDHIDNAVYDVRVDGQPLTNWKDALSSAVRSADGNYYVYWYVLIGTPPPGDHKITFKLTWSQSITDGYKNFGPGTNTESDTGTCVFTIK